MNHFVLPFVVGLVSGAGSGWAVTELRDPEPAPTAQVAPLPTDFEHRIAALESRPALLKGTPAPRVSENAMAERIQTLISASLDGEIEQRIEARVKAAVAAQVGEGGPFFSDMLDGLPEGMTAKKRVTLAEAAREVGLSASEEEDLRSLENRLFGDAMKIAFGDSDTFAKLIGELREAEGDPTKKRAAQGKLVMALATSAPKMMEAAAKREKEGRALLGDERWVSYESTYDITDLDSSSLSELFMPDMR